MAKTNNNQKNLNEGINYDQCPRCGKEIDLALPHSYDRGLKRPVHRECVK